MLLSPFKAPAHSALCTPSRIHHIFADPYADWRGIDIPYKEGCGVGPRRC
jgi:hypothetical protein